MLQNEIELAYAAGLIDGEGTIYLDRFKSHKTISYVVRVKIAMADKEATQWMEQIFGGKCRKYDYANYPSNNKRPLYIWSINGKKAIAFFKDLLPYLKIKIKQAETAIAFEKTMQGSFFGNDGRFLPSTPENIRQKEFYCEEMRTLNQRRV